MNNLVGDVKANPKDFNRYINIQKKDAQGIPLLKREMGVALLNRNPRKQQNSIVSSQMDSLNPNGGGLVQWLANFGPSGPWFETWPVRRSLWP